MTRRWGGGLLLVVLSTVVCAAALEHAYREMWAKPYAVDQLIQRFSLPARASLVSTPPPFTEVVVASSQLAEGCPKCVSSELLRRVGRVLVRIPVQGQIEDFRVVGDCPVEGGCVAYPGLGEAMLLPIESIAISEVLDSQNTSDNCVEILIFPYMSRQCHSTIMYQGEVHAEGFSVDLSYPHMLAPLTAFSGVRREVIAWIRFEWVFGYCSFGGGSGRSLMHAIGGNCVGQ